MKKILKGYLLGFISATLLVSCITAFAANTTILYDVIANGVKIVVDGQKLNPTDANGNTVEPFIYNGTTYLPVRAVANAFGKAVYWDGPNYTVYLGTSPDGPLPYPTTTIEDVDDIGDGIREISTRDLTDNYGNSYSSAVGSSYDGGTFQTLLNMKYSRFKGTIYVPKGCSEDGIVKITVKADGKTIYTSPEINKTSSPIPIDLNIKGCNDFQIIISGYYNDVRSFGYIADGGFYQ